MKCLIVAAGQGTRLREKGESKPLIAINQIPLIEHVIARARSAGADEFFVVSGYRGGELRRMLDALAVRDSLRIIHVVNERWTGGNGVSVLVAKQYFDGPFLLTMCDHLMDPDIFRDLIAAPSAPDTVTLAVDYNIDNPLNDPEDVTRVKCSDGKIEDIGKVIRDFNAIDTGLFRCTPVIFDALEASQDSGDDSISGAIKMLARWGKAHVFDIQDRLWVDVDDPAAFLKAKHLLETGRL